MCVYLYGEMWMSEWNDRWDLLFSCLVHKISVFLNDDERPAVHARPPGG